MIHKKNKSKKKKNQKLEKKENWKKEELIASCRVTMDLLSENT